MADAPPAGVSVGASHPAHSDAESGAPQHRHLGMALAIISAAQLMVVLDASIVNVALPSIQRALRFSAANLIWVVNGYTLAFGGLLLLGGRTGDLFGRRRMFMVGISIFTIASFVGGLATTEGWLVAARVVQGMGGAIASPTALSLIASTFPEGSPRNRAMGVYAAMSGAGAAIGVLLGGILTDQLGWRWVLFVNVPIGIAVLLGAPRVLGETPSRHGALDLRGGITETTGMSLLVFGLIHAASTSWGDHWTIASLVVGVVLLVSFIFLESKAPEALMPLRLFRNRSRSTAYGIMLAIGTAMFAMFYFVTLYLQDVLDLSPLRAGLAYLPFAVTIIVAAGGAARAVAKFGPRNLIAFGTLVGSGGLFWLSHASASGSYVSDVLGPMFVIAVGLASCFVPLTLIAVSGVERHEQGIASALLNSGQQVGGSLGLAVLGTIAVEVTRHHVSSVLSGLSPSAARAAARVLGAEPPSRHAPVASAVRHGLDAAYVSGYTTAFTIGSGILLFAFFLALFVLRSPAGYTGHRASASPVAP